MFQVFLPPAHRAYGPEGRKPGNSIAFGETNILSYSIPLDKISKDHTTTPPMACTQNCASPTLRKYPIFGAILVAYSPKAISFDHFHPRPPRLSPPQADDGGLAQNGQKNLVNPVNPVKNFFLR